VIEWGVRCDGAERLPHKSVEIRTAIMQKLRVESFTISIDGFAAGPSQSLEHPLVLTHHPRAALKMEGGTTFHFVTDGMQSALAQARQAANGKDVRVGGGAATIGQYLKHGLVDELHIAIAPVLLGAGERLFDGIDLPALGFRCTQHVGTPLATHVVLTKT
jgi:hypothetical protein